MTYQQTSQNVDSNQLSVEKLSLQEVQIFFFCKISHWKFLFFSLAPLVLGLGFESDEHSRKGQMSDRTGALQGANQISAGTSAPVAPPLEPLLAPSYCHNGHLTHLVSTQMQSFLTVVKAGEGAALFS